MEKIAPVPVVIFYDLETTGFNYKNNHKDEQILSIGAVNGKTGDEYHKYMVPTCEIPPDASRVNHIERSGDGLTLRGVPVEAGQPKEVLEDFMDWLDRQSPEPVLVAHNNYAFDAVVLKNNLKRFGVQRQIRNSQNKDSWVWMTELRDQKKFPELDFQTCKLEQCLKIFKLRDEDDRSVLHDGLQDSKDCQLVCDRAAQKLGFQDYANYLAGNRRQE